MRRRDPDFRWGGNPPVETSQQLVRRNTVWLWVIAVTALALPLAGIVWVVIVFNG